ncbi:uncharacterized protein LOC143065351 isoform X2 [Mytilus galloprovincialis]|uniref:uncharacterized protein LOC143065351 isoform X2 n=1 Tax=Mytilus galloprovincialis TaxID=29158 RepID=UPI003F7C4E22
MEKKYHFRFMFFFSFLMCTIVSISAWDGHVCTRKKLQYRTSYYCSCKRLWWCCGRAAKHTPYYTSEQICCPGWEHNGDKNCNIPICIPPCQNGGTCVNPNECECAAGFEGDFCDGTASCSHLDPCYPGRCVGSSINNMTDTTTVPTVITTTDGSMNRTNRTEPDNCHCYDGFGGETCLLFSANFTSMIEQSNATFTSRKATTQELIFEYKIDATDKTGIDITWTNNPQFNLLQCNIIATFDADELFGYMPNIPDYIRNTSYGIVNAHFEIKHTKIYLNGSTYVANSNNLTCIEPTHDNPVEDLKCFKETKNDFSLSSGDVYSLRFIVISGGYRVLINTDYGNVTDTQYYIGPMSQNVIEFRFDYDVPIHCSKNKTTGDSACNVDSAMTLNRDITQDIITGTWSGWIDTLSGVLRYVFEVWKLEFSIDENGLLEPKIKSENNPKPLYITEIMADNISVPMYEPNGPGVYSVILEINDRANNSEYVRRIAIYDKTSQINTSSTDQLLVSSALSATDYIWQILYAKDNITQIKVNWTGHFFNEIHEKGHFLDKVLKYEARLSDPENPHRHEYKRILAEFDDNEGARTKSAIPNVHAIVKFEIIHEKITRQKYEPSESNWRIVSPLQEHDTIDISPHTIDDGYAVQVWVKAFDIMNHTKVDTTVVRFDQSPPDLYQPDITFNVEMLTSRLTITSKDAHSGLKSLSMKFVLNSTGEVKTPIQDILVPLQKQSECPVNVDPDCYCIQDECFNQKFEIDFDNCKLTIPVDTIEYETYSLHITTVNRAMLTTSIVKEIGRVTQFTGIQQYSSPFNISIVKTTDRTITIQWKLLPTCYDRVRNVVVVKSDNTTKEFKVDKDATEFTIPDLQASSSHDIKMYSDYGNVSSYIQSLATPLASAAFTADKRFVFILVVVVLVLVALGRMGKLNKVKRRMTKRMSQLRNTWYDLRRMDHTPPKSRNNRAISTVFDRDVRFHGDVQFEGEQHWYIRRNKLSLEEEIARGKFAIIFRAKLYTNKNLEESVVAKTVHEDCTDIQRTEMKAKINFYATKVGHHVNVLEFKGSCEDDARGDIMVLEYCDNGTLKQYLDSVRECFTAEISDKLARLAYGICLGMDYLASKEIVHRKLAARNILLNKLFEPKIAGFGPSHEEIGQNVNNIHENIPVKWVAPECVTSSDKATELSDAWSYGVVLWEIFSLGETPYPSMMSSEVFQYLKAGNRMNRPEYCEVVFHNIMKKCWKYDPNQRSGFSRIKEQLRPLFHEGEGDDIYMTS